MDRTKTTTAEAGGGTPSENRTGPKRQSFVEFVALMALLMALTALSIDIMLPSLPEIGRALGVSRDNDRQYVVILYMVGFAVGQMIYGPLSDRTGRRPMLLVGLAIYLVGTVVAVIADSFWMLLCGRLIQGFGSASPRVIAIAVIRDLYVGRQMARVMSLTMVVFIIVPMLAPSIGQALAQVGTWRWPFALLLIAGVIAAGWTWLRLPETGQSRTGGGPALSFSRSLTAVVFNRQTAAYGIASGFIMSCILAYVASAQQIFVEVFGLGKAFPIAFAAVALTLALASLMNSRIVGRLGMRRVSHVALVGFIAAAGSLVVAQLAGIATFPVFIVLLGVAFFQVSLITSNFNSLAMEPQGHNAGMASSIIGSVSTAISAIIGAFIGKSFDGTILPLVAGFAASSLVALMIVIAVEGRDGLFGRHRPML